MRTAKGLTIDTIEGAQDNLIVARNAGQVSQRVYSAAFDLLFQAKLLLVAEDATFGPVINEADFPPLDAIKLYG